MKALADRSVETMRAPGGRPIIGASAAATVDLPAPLSPPIADEARLRFAEQRRGEIEIVARLFGRRRRFAQRRLRRASARDMGSDRGANGDEKRNEARPVAFVGLVEIAD